VSILRAAALLFILHAGLHARHLPIQVFTSAQGLPRNSVNCIVPGPSGMLWLCTSEGLARFDGYRFRVFGKAEGLPARAIEDFVPSRRGGFWVVTAEGICRLPAGSKIGEPCPLLTVAEPTGDFSKVFESQDGHTYAATRKVLYVISPDGRALQRTTMQLDANDQIRTLADANDGALFVGSAIGLFSWTPGAPPRLLSSHGPALGPLGLLRISPSTFLMAATDGLYQVVLHEGAAAIAKSPLPSMQTCSAIVRRRDGSVWIGGVGGIARLSLDGPRIQVAEQFTDEDGLPSKDISHLIEDQGGNLWGATDASGVFRMEESGFVTYSTRDGLDNSRIGSIFEDRLGRLIVQTSWYHEPTIHVRAGDGFQTIPIRHPAGIPNFGWGWNQVVVSAHDSEWWIPAGSGMLRFAALHRAEDLARQMPVTHYDGADTGCLDVFRLFEDGSGDIWISCVDPRQLIRWERGANRFHHWTAADGFPNDTVPVAIRQGPSREIWIATGSTVVRFRDGRFEAFPLTPGRSTPSVRDLMIDHAGRVWLATEHAGIFRCDNPAAPVPTFRVYTTQQGLSSNTVRSLVEDRGGLVYAGTVLGVDRIDPSAPLDSGRIRHFGAAQGLPDSEQNTAFRDRRGRLWFGTLHGLAEFDPENAARQPPPAVSLMRIRIRGEEVPLPWEGTRAVRLDLAPDRNQVEIEFAGSEAHFAQSLRYQYRLAGIDTRWSDAVDQRSVNYASLPGGTFRFEVRAVDPDGQVSVAPAAFDLTIAVPLWRRWWFVALCAALVGAATLRVYNYRIRHLLAMERLRTRIATDLHDDIGASLSQISILSEIARQGESPATVADIADIARGLVQDMSDIVWAVNPRHDRLDGLVHRMRRFAGDTLGDIDLRFDAANLPSDSSVPLHIRRPLYLVFKEAVNNVARHSGASSAAIQLSLEGAALVLQVEDDGHGFNLGAAHEGEGLASITRRLREVGGSANWEPRRGGGTCFTAILPLGTRSALVEWRGLFRRGSN
jgi:signal transduction histidine kinase/ligand-binding sensor domain-containing protein